VALGAAAALAVACGGAEKPRGPLDYIQDEHFAIRDPGGRQAAATGTGCALARNEALTQAERAAHYNLRGVMGPGRYRVQFERLREFQEGERICFEVEARVLF
jgi:hypothetical protein